MCPAVACNYDTIDIINFGQDPTFGGNKNTPATVNINGTNVTGPFAPSGTAAGTAGLFYYPPPAGAKALCTANLPDFTPDVTGDTPQDYFKAVIWGGNNQSGRQIDTDGIGKGTGFQPDIVWVAIRSGQSSVQTITDSVRQVDSILSPNGTYSVNTFDASWRSSYGQITIFNSTGFQVNKGSATSSNFNSSNEQYVAWCWKAGGAPTADNTATSGAMTANSVSLNGTLQSNYTPAGSPTIYPKRMSINTDAGFSIVKWTGNGATLADNTYQSIPTGLSGKLAFAIQKRTNTTGNWHTYHKNCSVAHTYWSAHTYLNSTLVEQIGSGYDSQVFKYTHSNGLCEFQNGDSNNVSGSEYISYFFEEVDGYSKFGSYTGNGSADGPFVYCGFRPAFVMIKEIDTAQSWFMYDSSRDLYNPSFHTLLANQSAIEETSHNYDLDILSNGWKLRNNNFRVNDTSTTYIFMAFAEQPFNYATAR
jgi:hypothetical protein